MSLEHFIVAEKKKVLKFLRQRERERENGDMSREHRSQPERAPIGWSWNTLSKKINNRVLNYNGKSKTNIHKSIII